MAWIYQRHKGARWRLFDRIGNKVTVIVRNVGIHKGLAEITKFNYEKALATGFVFTPPITIADIEGYLKAKAKGQDYEIGARRLPIEEMCELYIKLYGPSLKGGVSEHYHSPYGYLKYRMNQLKKAWAGMFADEINKFHVRDYLARYKTIGTQMRNLGALGAMFRAFADWNEEGNILPNKYQLPPANPFSKWRKQMKPSQKKEHPDTRVLSPAEWNHFKRFLSKRALEISEIALKRFLRLADIRAITRLAIDNGHIRGIQAKTGERYRVPQLLGAPTKYDFTNYRKEFKKAQVAAGMDYPVIDEMHFTPKDLRRTGATWAYRTTKDLVGISELLGHQDISTTKRYLQITDTDKSRITDAVDQLADGLQPIERNLARKDTKNGR